MYRIGLLLILLSSFILTWSCSDEKSGPADEFDRKALLAVHFNNVLQPAYLQLKAQVDQLEKQVQLFNADSSNVVAVQALFKDTYLSWAFCSPLQAGDLENLILRDHLNVFPCSKTSIEANILDSNVDLNQANNFAAKGFPALDYLLFGTGSTTQEIENYFDDSQNGSMRKAYLLKVVNDIASRVNIAVQTIANMESAFKTNVSLSTGSSIAVIFNEVNKEIDLLKNNRFGIPAGKKSFGQTYPEKVEGYYSGISLQLAQNNLNAIKAILLGYNIDSMEDLIGFDDYADYMNAKSNGTSLSQAIKNQIGTTQGSIDAIKSSIDKAIINTPEDVNKAYADIQKLIIYTKSDLTSVLNIAITYQDNDGD